MAKSDKSNSAKLRRETQKRAAAKYGSRPFQGTDPFSKTAATLFSVPGTIAQGFSDVASGRRKVSLGDVAGVVAPAALAAGGMAVARVRASNSPAATRARVIASTKGAVPTKRGTYSNVKDAMEKSGYSYPSDTTDGWGGSRSGTMSPKRFAIKERKAYQEDVRRYGESTGYATAAQRNAIDAGAALGNRKRRVLAKIAYGYFGEPIKQPKRGR